MKSTAKQSMVQAYPRGAKVAVLNRSYSGKLILEGYARVVDFDETYNQYTVHFIGKDGRLDEHGPVDRFIEDEAQADPEKYVSEHQ